MNMFFIEFRDPLFSIIVFFALVFMITFFSYWYNRFRTKEDYRHLDKFLRQFRSPPTQKELEILISGGEISQKSWLLLAQSYFKNGDYEKSIEIYNEILKLKEHLNYKETLFLLGRTYFKAGFLQRAKQIFLQILKNNPRTPQALEYLLLTYEYMREYDMALEVLDSLGELDKDITAQKIYLKTLSILNNQKIDTDEKSRLLLDIYNKDHQLTYMIFEYIFRIDPKLAWENLDTSKSEELTDILWHVKKEDLNFDVIEKNGYLRELYTARGDVDLANKSLVFEFDILINLKGKADATLSFEYICQKCKQIYPFAFHRCSHCHSIDSSQIDMSLCKDYYRNFDEENNSFQ